MCTSQEAKRFYTLCFSSSFLFNVVIIRHFNTVNTLDMVEFAYLRTLTHVRNTVESGHHLYHCKAKMEDRKRVL